MGKKLNLITLALMVLLSGCVSPHSEDKGVEIGNVVEYNKEKEKIELENTIANEKERLIEAYGDGIYVEDYSEIQKKLDDQCNEYLSMLAELVEEVAPYWMNGHVVLSNRGYKEATDNDYDFEWIVSNQPEILDVVEIELYSFANGFSVTESIDFSSFRTIDEFLDERISFEHIYKMGIFDDDVLERIDLESLDSISDGNNRLRHILEHNVIDSYYLRPFGRIGTEIKASTKYPHKNAKNILEILEERYGIEFELSERAIPVSEESDVYVGKPFTFNPKFNPELRFVYNYGNETFSSVLVQYLLSVKMDKALKEVGLEERIGYFIGDTKFARDDFVLNLSSIETDPIEYLNNNPIEADIGIYYLISSDDGEDVETLMKLLYEFTNGINSNSFNTTYVLPYNLQDQYLETAIQLFDESRYSENYFRDDGFGEGWIIIRNDSECFNFLDVFGEKFDYVLHNIWRVSRRKYY